MNRTYCGSIDSKSIDKRITVNGWVNTRRDHGGVIFIDLRDHTGVLQVVFNPDKRRNFQKRTKLKIRICLGTYWYH
jgi:aspartyl-tRNA synthetase